MSLTGNVVVVGAAADGELGTSFKSWLWLALCGLGPRHFNILVSPFFPLCKRKLG